MDFTDKIVIHQKWGEGIVISHNHPYLKVQFGSDTRNLLFPDAFSVMIFANSEDQMQLRHMIAQHEWDNLKKAAAITYKPQEKPTVTPRRAVPTPKTQSKNARPNIVFKCNYCDGGGSKRHIGYMGVCSDETIWYNIEKAKHSWCCDPNCPCNQYYQGEIDGDTLDSIYEECGSVCQESHMLRDWIASAGCVLNGENREEPKKIRNIHLNSLAVLTTRLPNAKEADRFIFGVFLVDDGDEGDQENGGFVMSNSKYRIELTPEEALELKFWNYHANETKPQKASWGQGLYRYITDAEAVQILRGIAEIKRIPAEKKAAVDFLDYFCKINGIDQTKIPEPNGALHR